VLIAESRKSYGEKWKSGSIFGHGFYAEVMELINSQRIDAEKLCQRKMFIVDFTFEGNARGVYPPNANEAIFPSPPSPFPALSLRPIPSSPLRSRPP